MSIKKIFAAIAFFYCTSGLAQDNSGKSKPVYDSALAKKLGADEYGMKNYVMAFLKKGTVRVQDSAQRSQIIIAHLKNIQRLAAEGKLIIAGPFLDDQDIKGIFIFNLNNVEEARKLTETDPAVKAGLFAIELHPWYGSAALIETVRIHQTIEKRKVTD